MNTDTEIDERENNMGTRASERALALDRYRIRSTNRGHVV